METINLEYNTKKKSNIILDTSFQNLVTEWKRTPSGRQVVIVTHPELEEGYATPLQTLFKDHNVQTHCLTVPSGEPHKNMATVQQLLESFFTLKLERKDTIIACGGGIIGDMVGFATAIYLRGIHLIQCPTTLLAQVDAAIGGKTAVNHPNGKNLIGSFYQPNFTFINTSTLKTLPKHEMRCGMAEIVKYGIIRDPALFNYLETHQQALSDYTYDSAPEHWTHIIRESCRNKADVVQKDEHESGIRETLNLGHTFGHAIEAAHKYKGYSHGDAVALGMACAAYTAHSLQLLSSTDYNRILDLMTALNFEIKIKAEYIEQYIPHLAADKKVRNGKVRFILPTAIGETIVKDDLSETDIRNAYTAFSKGETT